ncbi:hypothetical protein [Pseudomonas sp.]|uniref:hypothetical protein n=1 Tax=Pseudomonas sp. TaxID=306 RepID=UPI001E55426D|nr:hypothetical protein [Pseudomonas sp.]
MPSPPANTKNPLTIIAIFAAIVEASALASLPFLKEDSQDLYTWFLVGFPPFLTLLFFVTLNFNYKVLYSPSDFNNPGDFMQIANGPPLAVTPVALHPAAAVATPPTAATNQPPRTPDPPTCGPQPTAVYVLDCRRFDTAQSLNTAIDDVMSTPQENGRHLILLYQAGHGSGGAGERMAQALARTFAQGSDCIVSAYDVDTAALVTLNRQATAAHDNVGPA